PPTPGAGAREGSCLAVRLRDDEGDLVHVAPAPVLAALGGADDRMAGLVRVTRRVPVRRRVATADLAAAHAHPQVDPAAADLQALLAAHDRLRQRRDRDPVEMRTGCRHKGFIAVTARLAFRPPAKEAG